MRLARAHVSQRKSTASASGTAVDLIRMIAPALVRHPRLNAANNKPPMGRGTTGGFSTSGYVVPVQLPTLYITSLKLRRCWQATLDYVQHQHGHVAVRYRNTSTLEIVTLDVHDIYRRALQDTSELAPAPTDSNGCLDLSAATTQWVSAPSRQTLLALARVQERVRAGLRITVLRFSRPSVVLIPPSWATAAREALSGMQT